ILYLAFFFQAEDGIRDGHVTGVQTCALPIWTFGERTIRFSMVPDFFSLVERIGHVPLPPYIDRPDRPGDGERYQTVYAQERGSEIGRASCRERGEIE